MISLAQVLLISIASASQPQYVVKQAQAPTYKIAAGKGTAQLYLNETTSTKEAALTILTLEKGATVPEHIHENSAEILYLQSGAVTMTIDGKPYKAKKGDAIYIPAGVKHSAHVPHTKTIAAQVYVGPGPEQRFVKQH